MPANAGTTLMVFIGTTEYESRIIAERVNAGEGAPVAIHRYFISTEVPYGSDVLVYVETNDDNDDGYPDGDWTNWTLAFRSVEKAREHCGVCRIGISGVIVTVTLNGEEIHA